MERSQDWLYETQGDHEHARSDGERGYHNWAFFGAQQAADKAVKATFQKMGAEARGHSWCCSVPMPEETIPWPANLLVVYSGEKQDDPFAVIKKTPVLPGLEPHVYTEGEYEALKATIAEMIEGGNLLYPD